MNMTDPDFRQSFLSGYADGVEFHIGGISSAKDWARYTDEPGYEEGFTAAGDDS